MNVYVPEFGSETKLGGLFPRNDRSLNLLAPATDTFWYIPPGQIWKFFFASTPGLGYMREALDYMRVITYPVPTSTAQEKITALNLPDTQGFLVVRAMVWRDKRDGGITITVAPATGFVELKAMEGGKHLRPVPGNELPGGMEYGICTPFIPEGTDVERIVFDERTLECEQVDYFDFSIALTLTRPVIIDSHMISVQMPYARAYYFLANQFPGIVQTATLL